MSVDAIINKSERFSLIGRTSIFSQSAATDSTAWTNPCNSRVDEDSRLNSGVSILSGNGSLAFGAEMDSTINSTFDMRKTVGIGCKLPRRATINVIGGTIPEDSRESCLDESVPRVSELEGTINATNGEVTNIKSASKCGSVGSYRNNSPARDGPKSNRSSGSGQKRDLKMRS